MGSFTNVIAAREKDAQKQKELLAEAMGYLHKARELSPKRQEIFVEIEKNYLIAENYAAMEITGKECVAIDSRFGECHWHLGISQIFLGNQEEGTKNIELAFQNGYVTPPYKQLAVAYMSQKNWKAATAAYEKIPIYYDEASVDVAASHHATLAYLYKQSGNYTKAGEEALKVFRLQPDNQEVVQFIDLLLAQIPSDPIINSSLAFIYAQPGPQQEVKKAISIYSQLMANYPNNPDYRWRLIEIYYEQKDYDRAYAQIVSMLKVLPNQREGAEDMIKKMPPIHWYNYTHNVGF
jgi:tetratricopeptide (TPR) repeat protein